MKRLLVHVEGETEESFVNEALRPFCSARGFSRVDARLLGNSRNRSKRGGVKSWETARTEIVRHLVEDAGIMVTTMVDYYAMPRSGSRAWPGRDGAPDVVMAERAGFVERAMIEDVAKAMGGEFVARRFIPFVVMHEFEGLLFSDPERFARAIGKPALGTAFRGIREQFGNPEEINDSPETAPSKRIVRLAPEYQKPLMGTIAAIDIGVDIMARVCPGFGRWIERLTAAALPLEDRRPRR